MSVQAMAWVLEHSQTEGTGRLVMMVLANYMADHDGDEYCWPGVVRIARQANCSVRAVQNGLRQAEQLGELTTEIRGSHKDTNIYRMPMFEGGADSAPVQISAEGGADSAPKQKATSTVSRTRTKNAAPRGAAVDNRPDHDQLYLDEKIAHRWEQPEIGVKGLQRLNNEYGRPAVTSALRQLHGFPPATLGRAYGYVVKVCRQQVAS